MTNIMEEQLTEIADLHEKNKELYRQIGDMEEALSAAQQNLAEWDVQYRELMTEYGNFKERQHYELEKHKGRIGELEKELVLRREEVRRLNEMVCSMERSVSWKLTSPLRRLRWMQLKGKQPDKYEGK